MPFSLRQTAKVVLKDKRPDRQTDGQSPGFLDTYINSSSLCSHHLLITSLITLKELLTGMKELPMQENEAVFLWPHFYQNDTYF